MRYAALLIVAIVMGIFAAQPSSFARATSVDETSQFGSVKSCIKGCGDNDGCIACCICVAHGGHVQQCCI
jgi:hypothetical protein